MSCGIRHKRVNLAVIEIAALKSINWWRDERTDAYRSNLSEWKRSNKRR